MCTTCASCHCMQKRYYLNKYSHYSANHLSNSYNHLKKAVNIRYFSTYRTYKAGLPIGYQLYQGYKTLNSNIHRFLDNDIKKCSIYKRELSLQTFVKEAPKDLQPYLKLMRVDRPIGKLVSVYIREL